MKIIEEYNDGTIASSDAEGLAMVGRAADLLRRPEGREHGVQRERARVEGAGGAWRRSSGARSCSARTAKTPADAAAVLHDGMAIAPHDPRLLVEMARTILEAALDFDAAEKLVKEALAIEPEAHRRPSRSAPGWPSATWTSSPRTPRWTPGSR